MASNYLSTVPKLKGRENYADWAFAVENLLVLDGLSTCISGTEQNAEQIGKAKAKLILSMDPSLFVHIKAATTAKEVWDKLKALFDDSGFTRKIGLLRSLISIRLENCDSMGLYVNQLVDTAQKLQSTGFKIDDEWIGSLLLAGLSEKYSPMIMAIEHSGIVISTDAIKSKLLDMEPDVGNAGNAFVSKVSSKKNKHGSTEGSSRGANTRNVKCYRCKQMGHFQNKCPNAFVSGNKNDGDKPRSSNAFSAVFLSGQFRKTDWYIDSGASVHLTTNKDWLENVSTKTEITEIIVANKNKIPVLGKGEVKLITVVGKEEHNIKVTNALYVPELTTNLLSVSQLIKNGNSVRFETNCCKIFNADKKLVATANLCESVYKLNVKSPRCESSMLSSNATAVRAEVWHRRYGHVNYNDLKKLQKGAVNGLMCNENIDVKRNCIVCCEGKQSRFPFKHKSTRVSEPLELIHADVCGPMENRSIGGSKYFLIFEDDYSRMVFVYFMKTKDEVNNCFEEFKVMVENQTNLKIKKIRTDNGGEFCSKDLEKRFRKYGIIHQTTNPYTPEQNGRSERMNRTIVEKAKCLLFEANLEKHFWAEAVNTAVYLRNRSIASGLNDATPYEMWHGQKPDVSNLRIFGSPVMVHVPKARRLKWDKKSKKMTLVGFSETTKGYRLYDSTKRIVITSRDVVIMEDIENKLNIVIDTEIKNEIEEAASSVGDESYESTAPIETEEEEIVSESECSVAAEIENSSTVEETRKSSRQPKPKVFEDYVSYMCSSDSEVLNAISTDPGTVQEALSRHDREKWKEAMLEELQSFEENEVWELCDPPSNETVVDCKWVFKVKVDSDNNVRHKARLVARGFSQKYGIDFEETFSPVVRHSTLRLLIALAAKLNLNINHVDVNTAFLNGKLEETVYMKQPEGFVTNDKVYKLNKAVYGLKQSSRAWNKKIDDVIIKLGYNKSKFEPCLYTKTKDHRLTIIALYVDDFLIFSNDVSETTFLKNKLSAKFKIKDLGDVKQCLGMRINVNKNDGFITLDQENYINQLLSRFNMENCKPVSTPIEPNLQFDPVETNCDRDLPYQQLIGSLMYLSILTRPDIAFSVSYLSQFNNSFNETHWKCAKRVLKYLQGTKNYCLKFERSGNELQGYVDADWANDKQDRKSYTGFIFTFANSAVSWQSRKQKTVALSSTEAEYMALSEAAKEAIYLRNLLYELTGNENCIALYNDNQSAQKLSANPVFHSRSKHIDVKHHFIREVVSSGNVRVFYMSTSSMPADLLTKGLCKTKHFSFIDKLGLAVN